ncbi:MAG TPA: lectin [Xanthomonadaceae bacterium]|nr:lectin [Xanthomonadaceae bacterium]
MRASPLLPALLLLVACARVPEADGPPATEEGEAATPADAAAPAVADIERPARDAPARGDAGEGDAASPAHANGYAALRFGMDEPALRAAWDGPALQGLGEGEACRYLSPEGQAAPAVLAFMLEGGRFVRYDVGQGNAAIAAPGGGRIGMDANAVRALYPGAQQQPHKYVPEGRVLRVPLQGGTVLVFETGADGRVSAWRVGLPPQVDYVEGCS